MKKSPLQYPKSAASLSDCRNHSLQMSECGTDISNLYKKQFHSAAGQSERWLARKAKAVRSPPFSQHRCPPRRLARSQERGTANTNCGFPTPPCAECVHHIQRGRNSSPRRRGAEEQQVKFSKGIAFGSFIQCDRNQLWSAQEQRND